MTQPPVDKPPAAAPGPRAPSKPAGMATYKRELRKAIAKNRIEPEITSQVCKKKLRIYEIPISYSGRTYEEGKKIGLKDAFSAFFSIVRFRYFD